jgi:hypothetical protein
LAFSSLFSFLGLVESSILRAQKRSSPAHFPQSQLFPQLHSLLSFIGQFLPVVLQFGLSAAKDTVQSAATRIENKIFV